MVKGTASFVGGTYRAGKGLIFGTSLTTKNAKKKAQARAYGLNNISHKNIDAATGRVIIGSKAKKSIGSKIFRRKDGKQLSNDLARRMKEEYFGAIGMTAGVVKDSVKVPLRGALNAAKLATAIPLAVAGQGSLALHNVASATGSMIATHEKRKNIRGARKEATKQKKEAKEQKRKAKYDAMSTPRKVAYNVSRAALAVPRAAGKLVSAPLKGIAGTVQDTITAEEGKIDYVQTKAPTKLKRIKEARKLEDKIVTKYNKKLEETIQDMKIDNAIEAPENRKNEKFVETIAKNKFNNEVEDSIKKIFRVSDKVDKFSQDIGKSNLEENDVSNALDQMKEYMKQNIKNNDSSLSEEQVESKVAQIHSEIKVQFGKQKDNNGTLSKDKLKNIIEDTLEKNDADEKVSGFMKDLAQDMKDLQRTDRNFSIHFGGGETNYMYRHEETGKSNLKNVLNSLTYLER